MTEARTRSDARLVGLGQDILGERFDERAAARDGSARTTRRAPVGDALTDQRTLAGIGNIWKSESCFAASLDPWKRLVAGRRRRDPRRACASRASTWRSRRATASSRARAPSTAAPGEACPRCGTPIRSRRAGRAEPHDLLVPAMPALIRVGHRGAPVARARQHDRELRRGARDRRRHDRVRRAPGARRLARALRRARPGALDTSRRSRWRRRSSTSRRAPFAGIRLQLDIKRRGVRARVRRRAGRERDALARVHQHRRCAACCRAFASWRPRSRSAGRCPTSRASATRRGCARLYAARSRHARRAANPRGRDRRARAALARSLTPRSSRRSRRRAARSTCGRSTTPREIARLAALGVTGVITNDPRLFGAIEQTDGAVAGRVAPAPARWPAVVERSVARDDGPRRRHSNVTTPRSR